ncbi:MAG: histidine kinase [Bacteroidetes bacterium]|nr:histidine kinase [Bacteroidota bacterium]
MHRGSRLLYLLLSLFTGLPALTQAQALAQPTKAVPSSTSYVTRNIDISNGLACNDVFSIAQDRHGYIWIGSRVGMQRYDGLRFMNCFDGKRTPQSLNVQAVIPDDARGRILYDLPNKQLQGWDILRHESVPVNRANSPGQDITYHDSDGASWLVRLIWTDSVGPTANADLGKASPTTRGIVMLKRTGEQVDRRDEQLDRSGFCVIDHQLHETWMLDSRGKLLLLDDARKTITFQPLRLPQTEFRGLMSDSHGNIWINSWTHLLYRFNRHTRKLYTYSLSDILRAEGNEGTMPVWAASILEDNHGVLWFGTGQAGLLRYDYEQDRFIYLLREPGNTLGLQYTDQINTLFQDKEENIWIGSDRGISIINPYRRYFSIQSNQDSASPSKVVSDVIPAALIKRNLWTGSWGAGIKIFDTLGHLKKHIFYKGQYDLNLVWALLEQKDGVVWAGCQGGEIQIIDGEGGVLSQLHPPEVEGHTIKALANDSRGNTLLGLHSGRIIVYDKQAARFLPYPAPPPPDGFSPIEELYDDGHGTCWASTGKGLAEFNEEKRAFVGLYRPKTGIDLRCWGICPYRDSLLIVGIENDGLYLFDRRAKTFSKLPIHLEQEYWSPYAIAVDDQGDIWFSTDNTICRYEPATRRCFVSQPQKGLVNSSFQSRQFLVEPDGKWLTATSTEIVGFYPKQLRAVHERQAGVSITGFRVFSTPRYIDSSLAKGQPVRLGYKQNFIDIDFSSLQFSGVEQSGYFYKLEGVDPDWVDGGTRGSASYTNLSPGNYTFRVRSSNARGEEGATTFRLHIDAPFWATWWFRIAVLAVFTLVLLLVISWHDRRLRREAGMKQQIAQTEMMALRAQMNPHFIFNCINSIDALIQSDDKYLATVYLNKFARLIRNILDSSKQNTVTLARDLETLQLYIDLERFRSEDRFIAEIRVDPALLDEDCRVPPLIIQPYVENAILHGLRNRPGKGGRLTIDIRKEDDCLVYCIEDNGVGRTAAGTSPHRSYGMEMSGDRVRLFNREQEFPVIITDLMSEGRPAGTRVRVSLKID